MYCSNHIKYFIIFSFTLFSCKSEKKSGLDVKNKNPQTEMETTANEKKYSVYYELNLPFEILVNDVVVEKNMETGMDGPDQLNQFILENGEQKIRIKVMHPFANRGGTIKPQDIAAINEKLRIYLRDKTVNNGKLELIKTLNFPLVESEVPFIENEWFFEAELPFDLEGWENSKDLTGYDNDELEKMVVSKFEELRKLLNSGDVAAFMKELKFRNDEFYRADYFTPSQIVEYEANLSATFTKFKNLMLPLDKYRMRILGDGKVVSLERIDKYEGQGVLIAEDNNTKMLYTNYVLLHMPVGKETFQIVRINPLITSSE